MSYMHFIIFTSAYGKKKKKLIIYYVTFMTTCNDIDTEYLPPTMHTVQ